MQHLVGHNNFKENPWRDLELAVSVENLLVVEDQGDWIEDFVAKALEDVKVPGVIEGARRIGPDAMASRTYTISPTSTPP